jgi:hypothetical protein
MPKLCVLDFDIENRPLAYMGEDYTSGEITAIAACWHGKPKTMKVWLLGRDNPVDMLQEFRVLYDQADMVTGHYIRGHDLPVISGALIEHGLLPLAEKLTCDTKLDLVKHKHLSASQENLSISVGIPAGKVHMSNAEWREANRLTPEGLKLTEARAAGDVIQHMQLRDILVKRNLLRPPKVWRP